MQYILQRKKYVILLKCHHMSIKLQFHQIVLTLPKQGQSNALAFRQGQDATPQCNRILLGSNRIREDT